MTLAFLLACAPAESNLAPEVSMTAPSDGESYRSGVPFTATGVVDDNDGPNSLTIAWTFDPQPEESGNALHSDGDVSMYMESGIFAEGHYDLTLTAVDVLGLESYDSVGIDVEENDPPTVIIKEPNENEVYDLGTPLIVEATVNGKDDDMAQIALSWGGVADGAPDAPVRPPENGLVIFYIEDIPFGNQSLTITATDTGGQDDSATVNFKVH